MRAHTRTHVQNDFADNAGAVLGNGVKARRVQNAERAST